MHYDPEKVTFFAQTDARGQRVKFGIKAKDRTRHMYVIGKTGMGKSTLLENMAVQDIQNGEGIAFIDPHGQTAETLLDHIPEHRVKDVLYFAPFDMEHPVSFNVMEDVGPDKRHLVVSGLMSVFEKIWVDAWSARMAYILQNTLMALLEYPDSTLLGVNRMLSDKNYRKRVVDNIQDPSVKSFWVDEFAKYNERYMQEAGDAIKNKIGQFTSNPLIRNIIGQPKSSFDIRTLMDEKKILIMNLSKGLVGESNANLLGSMLTTRIYLAAMSRADLSVQQMQHLPNFYFYVDEFQSFANATFADILSEARKYKLNLTIAHQYIEQMEEEVKNAVFGNVGTIISFRVGPFDAEVLETIYSPQFLAVDICNLGFAQIYLTLMIDGIGSPPFSAVALPPIERPSVSCKEMVLNASREQFAFARPDVEKMIIDWHTNQHGQVVSEGAQPPAAPSSALGNTGGQTPTASTERTPETTTPSPTTAPASEDEKRPPRRDTPVKQKPRPQTSPAASAAAKQPPRKEKKKPEDQLEELRSVLRGLVQTEKPAQKETDSTTTKPTKKPQEASAHKQSPTPSPREAKRPAQQPEVVSGNGTVSDRSRNDLRQALSAAVQQVSVSDTSPKEQAFTPPANDVSATPARVAETDPLDPKQLERMMRVKRSDTPPFK